ncbi:hypothetical protein MRO49_24865, partial [Escherichia coli]|uniref:hypothetical protein n=1 Tax=Escherichia coli TaxID=562 RepID=UPI0021152D0F
PVAHPTAERINTPSDLARLRFRGAYGHLARIRAIRTKEPPMPDLHRKPLLLALSLVVAISAADAGAQTRKKAASKAPVAI